MKRKLKFIRKSVFAIILLAIIVNIFTPLKALADDTYLIYTFSAEGEGFTLTTNDDRHVQVNGDFIDFHNSVGYSQIDSVEVSCTDNTCIAKVPKSTAGTVQLDYNDGQFDITLNGHDDKVIPGSSGTIFNTDAEFDIKPLPNNPEVTEVETVLIWSCGTGVCFHGFDNENAIPVVNTGFFIAASEITDDGGSGYTFDVNAEYKSFVSIEELAGWLFEYATFAEIIDPADYNNFQSDDDMMDALEDLTDPNSEHCINWSSIDPKLALEHIDMSQYEEEAINEGVCSTQAPEDEFHDCVDNYVTNTKHIFVKRVGYPPVGEPYLKNAYVSYADRNFKAIIYNNKYRALSVGSLEGLDYYPGAWKNELTRQDSYDISETTKSNPTDITAVLLESKINLVGLGYNGFEIKSIEALDVPKNAVTITKENNGSYTFEFSSNFYDRVVFKVTDTSNNTYYFRIVRTAITARAGFAQGQKFDVYSEIYYDRQTSYTDYVVSAKYLFKDGTTKIVELKNAEWIDDGLGNTAYVKEADEENPPEINGRVEWPTGKGLKRAGYRVIIPEAEAEKLDKIYLNVEKKGSSSTNYAGAYTGSGKGVIIDMSDYRRS